MTGFHVQPLCGGCAGDPAHQEKTMYDKEDVALWQGLLLGAGLGLAFWLSLIFLFTW